MDKEYVFLFLSYQNHVSSHHFHCNTGKMRQNRKKSLTHKISSGIKAFQFKQKEREREEKHKDDWMLTWFDVSTTDSKLRSLYKYVLRMSKFYDPRRTFPCDSFGSDWACKDSFDPKSYLKWAKRLQVCNQFSLHPLLSTRSRLLSR